VRTLQAEDAAEDSAQLAYLEGAYGRLNETVAQLETRTKAIIDDYQRMLAVEARIVPIETNAAASLREMQKMRDLEARFKCRD
jgi:hypothetical protein